MLNKVKTLRNYTGLLVLCAGIGVLAIACNSSSSPTTPVAAEQQAPLAAAPASTSSVGDDPMGDEIGDVAIYDLFATARDNPELRTDGDEQYYRLEVSYRKSPEAPGRRGVFRFYGETRTTASSLTDGAEFFATVKEDGKDGRDWYPAFRVLDYRELDQS